MSEKTYINQAELAKVFDVSKSAISQKKSSGTFDHCYEGKKLKRFCTIAAYVDNIDWAREAQIEAAAEKKNKKKKTITQKELAEIFEVSEPHVTDLAQQGVFKNCYEDNKLKRLYAIVAFVDHKAKKIDKNFPGEKDVIEKETKEDIKNNTDLYNEENLEKLKDLTSKAKNTLQEVQIINTFWMGKTNELNYEEKRKTLVSSADVIKIGQRIVKAFRDKTLALPTKLAGEVVGLTEKKEAAKIIESYCYELLEELSGLKYDE